MGLGMLPDIDSHQYRDGLFALSVVSYGKMSFETRDSQSKPLTKSNKFQHATVAVITFHDFE